MDIEEILSKANIEENLWVYCFVDETKGIWQPQMDEFGKIIKTGEALYIESLIPPLPPQPTVEDFNLEMDYRVTMLEMIGGI